jgi:hypothetical protein
MKQENVSCGAFFDLRRKLWVEAMAAAMVGNSACAVTYAAQAADKAVVEFDKRFRAV